MNPERPRRALLARSLRGAAVILRGLFGGVGRLFFAAFGNRTCISDCFRLGLRFTIEDSWGGDVTTAAVSHLAASTTPDQLLMASFMNDWTLDHVAGYLPRSEGGRGAAPTGPGLGVTPDLSLLGRPLLTT